MCFRKVPLTSPVTPLQTVGQEGTEAYCHCVVYCGALSLYYLWPGLCIYQPPDQGACVSSVPSFVDLSRHRCFVCLHLCAVRYWSHPVQYRPKIVRGGASRIAKVFFEGATCGEVFINSKMSFRTAEKNYSTLLVR